MDVRARMINAGILIIDKHGKDNVPLLFPIFESYLNKKVRVTSMLCHLFVLNFYRKCLFNRVVLLQASDEEKYDLVREGVVIFTGALAKHLAKVLSLFYLILHIRLVTGFGCTSYMLNSFEFLVGPYIWPEHWSLVCL
jgi:hypothetical protein